jgi:hypothetical protein
MAPKDARASSSALPSVGKIIAIISFLAIAAAAASVASLGSTRSAAPVLPSPELVMEPHIKAPISLSVERVSSSLGVALRCDLAVLLGTNLSDVVMDEMALEDGSTEPVDPDDLINIGTMCPDPSMPIEEQRPEPSPFVDLEAPPTSRRLSSTDGQPAPSRPLQPHGRRMARTAKVKSVAVAVAVKKIQGGLAASTAPASTTAPAALLNETISAKLAAAVANPATAFASTITAIQQQPKPGGALHGHR